MSLAVAAATGRYGHVMFPGNLHPPAVILGSILLGEKGPGKNWAKRVFYSDNGATAVEIAIKMAFRLNYYRKVREVVANDEIASVDDRIKAINSLYYNKEMCVLTQIDGYHGDTLG